MNMLRQNKITFTHMQGSITEDKHSLSLLYEDIKQTIMNKKCISKLSDTYANPTPPLCNIYLCSYKMLTDGSVSIKEQLDIEISNFNLEEYIDSFLVLEILKNINQGIPLDVYKHNKQSLVSFLIRIMYKRVKIDISIKVYAYETILKLDYEKLQEILIYDLPYLTNFKDFKANFILEYFRKNRRQPDKLTLLFATLCFGTRSSKYEKILLRCKSDTTFVISFINFYLKTNNCENTQVLLEYFAYIIDEANCDASKDVVKKAFGYLLKKIIDRNEKKRYLISKCLVKVNLQNLVFDKRKLSKICKKLLKEKSLKIYELAVYILSIINEQLLLDILQKTTDTKYIKIILQHIPQQKSPIVYKKYLELKCDVSYRSFDMQIDDMQLFSKSYYNFHNKEVVKHMNFHNLEITDLYTLDLVMNYSKYHPEQINENYIVSLLFEKSDNILRNIKIINILSYIYRKLRTALRKQLTEYLNTLVYSSAYTKSIGQLFFNMKYFGTHLYKTEYTVVVLASMNHPEFTRMFDKYEWSHNKERALIYILTYKPELGIVHKHRLYLILEKSESDNLSKYNLLEFLYFLTSVLEMDIEDTCSDFYIRFIIKNKQQIYKYLEHNDPSIKIQAYRLVLKSTNSKILIKEESISLLAIYYKIDDIISLYNQVIISNLYEIFDTRIKVYVRNKNIYDEYFLITALSYTKFDIDEFISRITRVSNTNEYTYIAYYILYVNLGSDLLNYNLLDDSIDLNNLVHTFDSIKNKNVNDIFKHNDFISIVTENTNT